MNNHWIAIDWGTTNFRAFLLDNTSQKNRIIAEYHSSKGILSVENRAFEATLCAEIGDWFLPFPDRPFIMSGMIGSQQGWHEAPYVSTPANEVSLIENGVDFQLENGNPALIIPGICTVSPFGLPDVMRGEETQLLALSQTLSSQKHIAILPGTHSKHAVIENGTITTFTSYMTGEIFQLLIQSSMIGKGLPPQTEDKAAFSAGVMAAQQDIPLTHLIFSARTKRVLEVLPAAFIQSYLSGLLIGYELATLSPNIPITLIGSATLNTHYIDAGALLGLSISTMPGEDAFLSGIQYLSHLAGAHNI